MKQYYANKSNDFWKLLGTAIDEMNLDNFEYKEKIKFLKKHKIGLWDVFEYGDRDGSSDSKIKNTICNNFSVLKTKTPNLKLICFNGKKAGESGLFIKKNIGYKTKIILSSSGANRRYEKKRLSQWKSKLVP